MRRVGRRIVRAFILATLAILVFVGRECLGVRAAASGWALVVKTAVTLGLNVNCACGYGKSRLLQSATVARDLELVEYLLAKGADVNAGSVGGHSALMAAAALGERAIAAKLIAAGADVNARPSPDQSILGAPVHNGEVETVRFLLSAGSDPRPDSATLLIEAIREKQPESLRMLLDAGCSVNARGPRASTPLMWAAMSGDVATLKLLLAHGADVTARNEDGRTALDCAMKYDNRPNAAVLRSYLRRITAPPPAR